MPLFDRYRFSFDTWRTLEPEVELEESTEIGDPEVELKDWRPIDGTESDSVDIVFVDGVRRTERAVYIEDEKGNLSEGIFVSIGAGSLHMKYRSFNPMEDALVEAKVRRYLVTRGDAKLDDIREIVLSYRSAKIEFKLEETGGNLSLKVNELMANLEFSVAWETYEQRKPRLMITDGTLHYLAKIRKLPFVGYVKRHRRLYVPSDRMWIFREMKAGQRTPIILIHPQTTMETEIRKGSLDKFTWYVKLSNKEGLTGLARLEMSADFKLEEVKKIADLTAWLIPKFSSKEFSDPRSPQNLIPIKHLENVLRRHLGSQSIIRSLIAKSVGQF